jgi:UDP-N-acetylmuramate dehydrogenase
LSKCVEIPNDQCGFSYRDSRFKTKEHGRFIISQITLQLQPTSVNYQAPNYPSLIKELSNRGVNTPQPKYVRQTVMAIRQEKLPDPARLANTGSFFKNPIVLPDMANKLLRAYPEMPHYPQTDGTEKLAGGWLIEQAGLKNYQQNGMWIYDKQALVLINESAKSFTDLWLMVEHIISTVNRKFGIILEPEPEII